MPSEQSDSIVSVENEKALLDGLLVGRDAATSAFRKRTSAFDFQKVHPADVAEWEAKGWEFAARGKRQHKMRRAKPHYRVLEDRAWGLLYRMGYPDIGTDKFVVRFTRDSGTEGTKQIDAFAVDSETAIVIECKSSKERGKRSLRQDLQETKSLQNYIRASIFSHYPTKPKLIWLYITSNIIWSEPDIERAKDANVYIITENELAYFETFIGHMGPAGRYQVLGEFLQGQKISNATATRIPAIRGKLGGQTFYSFVTTPRELLKIAFVNHQALNHPDATPAYQRMISPSRVKAIGQFIKQGGYFPTNILINFNDRPVFGLLPNTANADKTLKFGWLSLPNKYRSAWIIDGQHRLYGYSGLDDEYLDQSLNVIAFEGLAKAKEQTSL
jgi:Holliday junction resolvase